MGWRPTANISAQRANHAQFLHGKVARVPALPVNRWLKVAAGYRLVVIQSDSQPCPHIATDLAVLTERLGRGGRTARGERRDWISDAKRLDRA